MYRSLNCWAIPRAKYPATRSSESPCISVSEFRKAIANGAERDREKKRLYECLFFTNLRYKPYSLFYWCSLMNKGEIFGNSMREKNFRIFFVAERIKTLKQGFRFYSILPLSSGIECLVIPQPHKWPYYFLKPAMHLMFTNKLISLSK